MTQEHGQLTAKARGRAGKGVARKLRAAGRIPGVMYGKGKDNVLLSVNPLELKRAMDPERRLNTFFTVTIEGEGGTEVERCVIADCQIHATRDVFVHVDFLRVDPDTAVTATIPVEYTGRSKGVVAGGKLRTYRRTVKVAAKPAEVPIRLVVDVTDLEGGQSLRLKTLSLENARLLDHPETVMAHVDMPRAASAETEEEKT
jgi:large subunit ribosomal protein L25